MLIERPHYMNKLISAMGSDQVKIITGIRRCGKSFLVFELFKNYLISRGVPAANIVEMAFDKYSNRKYRDPDLFLPYVSARLESTSDERYVLLDEVQLLGDFSEVLIELAGMRSVDVYVTGSNAKLLSKDVVTEFRGRGREIRLLPLSFAEFMSAYDGDRRDGYEEYANYGGLPTVLSLREAQDKVDYLKSLYDELYLSDIVERNGIRDRGNLEEIVDVLSSGVGSLTNASRLSDTFKSEKGVSIAPETVEHYFACLEDAFLVSRARRYDLKGRRYIGTPFKFYFTDLGLRNARMNFRQAEQTHIMENVVYNELLARGFGVDVGVVPTTVRGKDGKTRRTQLEIDFVCNRGSRRCYVQSAFTLPDRKKLEQEQRPLMKVGDSFRKVVITKDGMQTHYDERGILMMNIYDFLLDEKSLEF